MSLRNAIALGALSLSACLATPPSTVPQSPDDRRAVDGALEAFRAARGPFDCQPLERVDVVSRPAAEVEARCYSPAQSCVYTVQRYVGAPASTLMYVRDDVDARTRAALIVHESLHAARACWAAARADFDDAADRSHRDIELWIDIERAALARWEVR